MPSALRQRQPEHAEPVGHADAEMDRERGRRNQPAVEAGPATMRSRSRRPGARAKSVSVPAEVNPVPFFLRSLQFQLLFGGLPCSIRDGTTPVKQDRSVSFLVDFLVL